MLMLLQEAVRNAEVEKAKSQARLAKLREGGIAVDQYIDPFLHKFERVKSVFGNKFLSFSPEITLPLQGNPIKGKMPC